MSELVEVIKMSKIPILRIKMGEEVFKVNIRKELTINTNDLNYEILTHPKVYGFLGLVFSKLKSKVESLEADKKRISAKVYLKAKREIVSGRPQSDDVCKAKVEVNKEYRETIGILLKTKAQLTDIEQVLDAFKQKKELIQTFSSNQRATS